MGRISNGVRDFTFEMMTGLPPSVREQYNAGIPFAVSGQQGIGAPLKKIDVKPLHDYVKELTEHLKHLQSQHISIEQAKKFIDTFLLSHPQVQPHPSEKNKMHPKVLRTEESIPMILFPREGDWGFRVMQYDNGVVIADVLPLESPKINRENAA